MKTKTHLIFMFCAAIFAIIVSRSFAEQKTPQIEKALSALGEGGIASFSQILDAEETRVPPISFDNSTASEMLLGETLLMACGELANSNSFDAATFDAILKTEQWVLQKAGARNLALACALEEVAWRVLARNLRANPNDVVFMANRIKNLREASPSLGYWKSVAIKSWPEAIADNSSATNQPEYMAFTDFAGKIMNCAPAAFTKHPAHFNDEGSIAHKQFIAPDNETLVIMAAMNVHSGIALETVCEIAAKTGIIPEERIEFISTAEKNASQIMDKRDRLGGWVTAGGVWLVWKDLIEYPSASQTTQP